MKKGKKQFIAGAMAGSLLFSIAFDLKRLDAIQDTDAWHRMAPELRLGYDLGFLPPQAFDPRNWISAITRQDFELAFDKAMQMLGISSGYDIEAMAQARLLKQKSQRRRIKRGEALNKVIQTLILLETYGHIKLPDSESRLVSFADYKTPPEYERAMTYLVNRGIVKGYSDGRLHTTRYLSNRDCVFLITRFYEALAAEKKTESAGHALTFVDLPLDHWIYKQLEGLASVGGLSLVQFGSSFDGDAWLSIGEFAGMAAGVLVHFNRSEALAEINELCEKTGPNRSFDRKTLARVLAVMLRNLTHLYPSVEQPHQIVYSDVSEGSDLAYDLAAISNYGIQLGYVGGRFAGSESITRHEAVGTLYAALAPLLTTRSELLTPIMASSDSLNSNVSPDSSSSRPFDPNRQVDIDEFVARIQEKQRMIRGILERKR